MTLPLFLTLTRLWIGPLFLCLYSCYEWFGISFSTLPYLLLTLLTLSELSDVCDGYFARKYQQVTDLGKVLDPMVDSIYRISIFFSFTLPPVNLSIFWVFGILYRDWLVNLLRTLCALKGYALSARTSGKLKAILQAGSVLFTVLLLIPSSQGDLSLEQLQSISTFFLSFASIYSLCSGVDYLYANRFYLVASFTQKKDCTNVAKSR